MSATSENSEDAFEDIKLLLCESFTAPLLSEVTARNVVTGREPQDFGKPPSRRGEVLGAYSGSVIPSRASSARGKRS